MTHRRSDVVSRSIPAGIALLVWPATAMANPVVPLIAVTWPVACLALLPVVLVEAVVATVVLEWDYGRALKMTAVANPFSTLVGVPLASFVNPAYWLGPGENAPTLVAILFPLYLASVACETLVADKFLELGVSRRLVWRWALVANALSYALIVAVLLSLEWGRQSGLAAQD